MGLDNPHIYTARMGLFDVDFLGHVNNAAYLAHAEYARWQMTSENGILLNLLKERGAFLVTANTIRYRQEIGPLFRKIQISTAVTRMNDRDIWMTHKFRHYQTNEQEEKDRVRAQLLVKACIVQRGKIVNPAEFLVEKCDMDPKEIEALYERNQEDEENSLLQQEIECYQKLEAVQRRLASMDDAKVKTK